MSAVSDLRAAPFEISAAGGRLSPDVLQQIVEVRIEQTVSMADRAVLRIADPDLSITDGDSLGVGVELSVQLGSPHADTAASEVFSGEIVTVEADMGPAGVHLLVIALDKSHRLRRQTRTKAFNNVTVSDVARQLMGASGLVVGSIDDTGPPRDIIFQDGESDWQLLERLCDEAGCDVLFSAGQFQIKTRRASGTAVELTLGETLRGFRPRLSGVAQLDSVEVRSWDPDQKQAITGLATLSPAVESQDMARQQAAKALGGGKLIVVDHPADSAGVAKTIAGAVAGGLGAQVIEATGVALGDPAIRAGGTLKLSGVGRRFGGEHRVVAATHVLRGGRGYETRFTLGAGGRPLMSELATGAARAPGFSAHLAIGLVTQNEDPEKQGRVKVKFPALDDSSESSWIRIAWPAAGSDRGMIALPAISDEVVVGFEHGDVTRPLVLGTLYNGQDKPGSALPGPPTPQSLGIKVPGDVVTSADGSVKTTAKQGISMNSNGPVSVAATGADAQLKITADAPIEITSKLDQKLTGMTATVQGQTQTAVTSDGVLQIKANGEITISGAAITVNSNGPLALKGMPVMIG